MKKFFYIGFMLFIFSSCGGSKFNISNSPEDKQLTEALKLWEKKQGDTAIQNQLKKVYNAAVLSHQNAIEANESTLSVEKWDNVLKEYALLQKITTVVKLSPSAAALLNPPNYNTEIQNAKQQGAQEFYNHGISLMKGGADNKENYRNAYFAFKKADEYVPGYKDVKSQMSLAFDNGILDVVINPVTDQSVFYSRMSMNRFGNSFNSDLMQRSLVSDLGSEFNTGSGARFYTDLNAPRTKNQIDWVVDITWQSIDIPYPITDNYQRQVSKDIKVGSDTSGKSTYEKVYATVFVSRKYFTARGQLECRVRDVHTGKNVSVKTYFSTVDWKQEFATYQGDYRALGPEDIAILNNANFNIPPRNEDILNELYRRIYPQLKSGIYNLVQF